MDTSILRSSPPRTLGVLVRTRLAHASLGLVTSCATVTQDTPALGGSGSESPLAPEVGGSGGARAPNVPAPAGNAAGQSGGTSGAGGGSTLPPGSPGNGAAGSGAAGSGAAGSGNAPADPVPVLPSGTLLLSEDFEAFQGESAGWFTSEGSAWELRTDPDDAAGSVYVQTETTSSGANLATAGSRTWTDVSVEADLEILEFNGSSSSYMAGICVRVQDASNFYLIGVRSNDGTVGLRRFTDGGSNLVQSDFDAGTTGVKYRLRVDAVGSTISAYLDGALMFSESDTTHPSGGIGLCTVRASAAFDNVRVSAP